MTSPQLSPQNLLHPLMHLIDVCFDTVEVVLTAQRSYLKGAMEVPAVLIGPLSDRLMRTIDQTANERIPVGS